MVAQQTPRFRLFENAHVALWLVKDTCWLLSYKTAALALAIPTIFGDVYHLGFPQDEVGAGTQPSHLLLD
jgi:hypothetical protein